MYEPSLCETTVVTTLPPESVTVTFAPGTSAPDSSVTCPRSVTVVCCAHTAALMNIARKKKRKDRIRLRPHYIDDDCRRLCSGYSPGMPPPISRFQLPRFTWPRDVRGAAARNGSTPAIRLIAVMFEGSDEALLEMISASPFLRSAMVTGGM